MKRNDETYNNGHLRTCNSIVYYKLFKDNDIPDAEKNAIQALNNIVGNYKGNLAATYGNNKQQSGRESIGL